MGIPIDKLFVKPFSPDKSYGTCQCHKRKPHAKELFQYTRELTTKLPLHSLSLDIYKFINNYECAKPPKRSRPRRKSTSPPHKRPSTLSPEQQQSIQEAFDSYANSEDGTLSVKRARHALKDILHVTLKREEIIKAVSGHHDDNNNDQSVPLLNWTTFSKLAASKVRQKTKSEQAFRLFDKDGKGLICHEDVVRVAQELGQELTQEDIEEMMNEADPSGEGLLDPDVFFSMLRKMNM